MQNHQKLAEDDFDRRLEFCEKVLEKIGNQNNFLVPHI